MVYFLAGCGLAILTSGAWLAHTGPRHFARPDIAERVAGLLIIAGLGCVGTGLGLCFGPPL